MSQIPDHVSRKNRRVAVFILAIVLGMLGMSYAAVPLYRLFCQVTGFGGQAFQSARPTGPILDRSITVKFNTDVSPNLPWDFKPEQGPVTLKIGQEALVSFIARNLGNRPVAGTALYNVTPEAAGKYFHKTQCFCFNYQLIAPQQTAHFPVVFYIDPEIANDAQLSDLKSITLSYSFFEADSPELENALEDFYNGQKSGTTSVKINR